MAEVNIIDVTADNVSETGFYCIKDTKSPGYFKKLDWVRSEINRGLQIKIATDGKGKQLGFIEFIPSEFAWRPIKANNYLFIQCIAILFRESRNKGIGSALIRTCELEAEENNKNGICTIVSDGAWMANKSIFLKYGFTPGDRLERFELLYKKQKEGGAVPQFINWIMQQKSYKGWNLIYADQCPWHEKSVKDIHQCAMDHGIALNVRRLNTPEEAQNGPSGYGTYTLIKDGKLLADHYISRTRFENIIRNDLN